MSKKKKKGQHKQNQKKEKEKKEKITYIDDNSTISDMNVPGHRWYNKDRDKLPPKKQSTAKEKAKTFFGTMKTMVIPMLMTLGILLALYLFILLFWALTK